MSATSAVRRYAGASILVLALRATATMHPFLESGPAWPSPPRPARSGPVVRSTTLDTTVGTCGGDGPVGRPAVSSTNRAIISSGPSACHSPVGPFQLRCYLLPLAYAVSATAQLRGSFSSASNGWSRGTGKASAQPPRQPRLEPFAGDGQAFLETCPWLPSEQFAGCGGIEGTAAGIARSGGRPLRLARPADLGGQLLDHLQHRGGGAGADQHTAGGVGVDRPGEGIDGVVHEQEVALLAAVAL